MQSNELKLVTKVQGAALKVEENLFKEWKAADTVIERELIAAKAGVLKDLTFELINNIRGNTDE